MVALDSNAPPQRRARFRGEGREGEQGKPHHPRSTGSSSAKLGVNGADKLEIAGEEEERERSLVGEVHPCDEAVLYCNGVLE